MSTTIGSEREQRKNQMNTREATMREVLRDRRREHRERLSEMFLRTAPGRCQGKEMEDVYEGWEDRMPRGAQVKLREFASGPARGTVLVRGTKGLGKTTLAVTLAEHVVYRDGVAGIFRSMPSLLMDFSYRPDKGDPIKDNVKAPVLILDDLGAGNEGMSDHQKRSLWALMDARWSNPDLLTIMTTNMSINKTSEGAGLADWLGPSQWDRVQDELLLVELNGESFRGR